MNKPDWENAPDWAVWLAQDASGTWWWYEREPNTLGSRWAAVKLTPKQLAGRGDRNSDWRETLEKRRFRSHVNPLWNDAPEWAMWLAQNADGKAWWFDLKPVMGDDGRWMPLNNSDRHRQAGSGGAVSDCQNTLEFRPCL